MATALGIRPVREGTQAFLGWLEHAGAWGPILLAAACIPARVLFIGARS